MWDCPFTAAQLSSRYRLDKVYLLSTVKIELVNCRRKDPGMEATHRTHILLTAPSWKGLLYSATRHTNGSRLCSTDLTEGETGNGRLKYIKWILRIFIKSNPFYCELTSTIIMTKYNKSQAKQASLSFYEHHEFHQSIVSKDGMRLSIVTVWSFSIIIIGYKSLHWLWIMSMGDEKRG